MGLSVRERNNVQVTGEGEQPMLFIHGYGCDQNMWRFVTPAFEKNFKIILIDLVGSGKSDPGAYNYNKYNSLQGYAADVLEVCRELDLQNIIAVGHSVSAMIASLAIIDSPELFHSMVMVCPSPKYFNDGDYVGGFTKADIDGLIETLNANYLGWSSAITPVIMGNPERPELSEELKNSFCRNNPDIARHFAKVTFTGDNRDDLEKLDLPVLVLQCSRDVIAPQAVGEYVHDHVKGSILRLMKATGHCPHLTAPFETINLISDFVTR